MSNFQDIKMDMPRDVLDDRGKFDESILSRLIIKHFGLFSINRVLYDMDGECDLNALKRLISEILAELPISNKYTKTNQILQLIITDAYVSDFKISKRKIHAANGTLTISETGDISFSDIKEPSVYRLPVKWLTETEQASAPRFDAWRESLFYNEDMDCFQEMLGYLLLPTTQGQKAFFILGKGGEGKSILGVILTRLLGNGLISCKIPELENNRFTMATIENKLVAYDDDLNHEGLKSTDTFKSLVTNKVKMQGERKGQDKFEFSPFARIVACGNFVLSALYDTTDGFFRRLLPIKVKPKPPNRVDISDYEAPMLDEMNDIFMWSLVGLQRLIKNDFKFSISQRSCDLLSDIREDANSVISFVSDKLEFKENSEITSRSLIAAYERFCESIGEKPRSNKTLLAFFKDNGDTYGIKYSKHINGSSRGFKGMQLKQFSTIDIDAILKNNTKEETQ